MNLMLFTLAFVAAALCAAVMGFAIQRGATCTVAAVDEVVSKRSARRLVSLVEASLWVAGGLLLARALDALPHMPGGYALTGWTVIGGLLLGLGAFVNRACVFGAIARLGSGEWAYAATPLGFYLGCVSVPLLLTPPAAHTLADTSPVLQLPFAALLLFLAFVAWRLLRPLWRRDATHPLHQALAARVWAPHAATTVIGITFLAMLLLVGAWAYTDVLAELARGMAASLAARFLLALALLAGAAWGGWTAGRFRATRITAAQLLRCLLGGALMGWGTLLIPGGNDGLILVGMPLLWPYAWVAFASMCVAIGGAQLLQRSLQKAPLAAAR